MSFFNTKPRYQTVLFQGIISIVIGGLLIINPQLTYETIIRFIGFLLLAMVFFNLVTAYVNNRHLKDNTILTISGGVMMVLGILLLFFPAMFVKLFLIFIGLVLFFAGISQIFVAIQFRFVKGLAWINFLIGLAILASSVFIITRPSEAANNFISLIGIIIMLHGFSELFLSSRIRAARKTNPGYTEDVEHEEV